MCSKYFKYFVLFGCFERIVLYFVKVLVWVFVCLWYDVIINCYLICFKWKNKWVYLLINFFVMEDNGYVI